MIVYYFATNIIMKDIIWLMAKTYKKNRFIATFELTFMHDTKVLHFTHIYT